LVLSLARQAKTWIYGDNIDTDVIIPARYLITSDPTELAHHAMEDLDPDFASHVSSGDVVVAGANFGCGSSREHAPIALKAAGVSAVVARSFARIFFRNAINVGLPICVSPAAVDAISDDDEVTVNLNAGKVFDHTTGSSFDVEPLPPFVLAIVEAGGLVEWVRARKGAA
jgi:3-isopropylmalate/(R)-2-methylmalate dehydratase small subunit